MTVHERAVPQHVEENAPVPDLRVSITARVVLPDVSLLILDRGNRETTRQNVSYEQAWMIPNSTRYTKLSCRHEHQVLVLLKAKPQVDGPRAGSEPKLSQRRIGSSSDRRLLSASWRTSAAGTALRRTPSASPAMAGSRKGRPAAPSAQRDSSGKCFSRMGPSSSCSSTSSAVDRPRQAGFSQPSQLSMFLGNRGVMLVVGASTALLACSTHRPVEPRTPAASRAPPTPILTRRCPVNVRRLASTAPQAAARAARYSQLSPKCDGPTRARVTSCSHASGRAPGRKPVP
jgi:hypothetical protein